MTPSDRLVKFSRRNASGTGVVVVLDAGGGYMWSHAVRLLRRLMVHGLRCPGQSKLPMQFFTQSLVVGVSPQVVSCT